MRADDHVDVTDARNSHPPNYPLGELPDRWPFVRLFIVVRVAATKLRCHDAGYALPVSDLSVPVRD
jgi:hypothetical protein